MLRSLFALMAVLILLCGCGKTTSVPADSVETPVETVPAAAAPIILSADAEFHPGLNIRTPGKNIEIYEYDNLLATIENAQYSFIDRSADRKAIVIMANTSGISDESPDFRGYSIYYYKDELIHIADEASGASISPDGSKVTYEKNVDFRLFNTIRAEFERKLDLSFIFPLEDDDIPDYEAFHKSYCDIYLWDGTDSEFVVKTQRRNWTEFSPDGKDLYYAVPEDDDKTGYYDWYFYNDGEPIFLFSDTQFTAVSNNSEYIYGYADGEYFVQKGIGGQRQFLALYDELETYDITYSADNSQVVFNTEEGFYISVNGGEAKRLSDPMKKLLLPELSNTPDDFLGKFYITTENRIYKITEEPGEPLVSESFSDAYMASDGETITGLVYSYPRYIASFNGNNPTESTIFKIEDGSFVAKFHVSYDGKTVFYSNYNGELFVVKNGEETLIDKHEDLAGNYPPAVVYDNDKLFYAYDDDDKLMYYDGEKVIEFMDFSEDIERISRRKGFLEVERERYKTSYFYGGVNHLTNSGGILLV
jgi:hypothetical protein